MSECELFGSNIRSTLDPSSVEEFVRKIGLEISMNFLKIWKKPHDCVRDVMSASVVNVTEDCSITTVAEKMAHFNIGSVPVITNEGTLAGFLTDRDIALRVVAKKLDSDHTQAKDVMTKDVTVCSEHLPLTAAVKLMEERSVRRLVVVDKKNKPLSIISIDDLALRANDWTGHVLAKIAQNAQISEALRA